MICTKPPACVLFQRDGSDHSQLDGLDAKITPVFPLERSITVKGHSVRRRQVPMCPAFSLTDYKVQGSTLTTAVLDLKHDPTARGQDSHKKYCSTYVQLSRLRSLDGLHLLQRIDMEDLRGSGARGRTAERRPLRSDSLPSSGPSTGDGNQFRKFGRE